jgi:uncharacterized SAM-binding protein YcdF (DUF218 family)
MFELKKIISSFLLPSGVFVSICFLLSFYFLIKKNKKRFLFLIFIGFLIWIFSSNFWINYFVCRLEKNITSNLDGDVIVFLSGGNVDVNDFLTGDNYLSDSSLERLFAVYRVYRHKKIPIILTGGYVFNMKADSLIAKKVLLSLGVDEKDIFIEDKSRDTYENALYSKKIADVEGFKKPILVTESLHIPRSIIAFKKAGFGDISVYPSSFYCHKISFIDFLPSDFHIHRKFFYEVIGKIYYGILSLNCCKN